jgi:hypothetical protein
MAFGGVVALGDGSFGAVEEEAVGNSAPDDFLDRLARTSLDAGRIVARI